MPTSPPALTGAPAVPDRADRPTFSARATAFFDWLKNSFVGEVSALANNVFGNATDAASSATAAEAQALASADSAVSAAASAATAQSVAGAGKWVSGQAYTEGQSVWSPINFQSYRRRITGAGTTDPSLDETNWAVIGAVGTTPGFVLFNQGVL